jgi:3-oxoacyl-[acyl-carrier-protein] synthase II
MHANDRIVITGVGLTAPNGNNLAEFRSALLEGKSGITRAPIRHMKQWPAGLCHFDEYKYMPKKMRKRGTRAGSIAVYCANEALAMSGLDKDKLEKDRVGVYLGITEHGNVETENEIHDLYQNNLDVSLWSHHHNPRTVANAPAGEVTLNLGITGPAYTIGAACAAGNLGLIHGAQMLRAGEVDVALAGGISESTGTFGIYAAFLAQGALGDNEDVTKACKPLDKNRNGIVVSEGGAVYVLERLDSAQARGATILAEIKAWHVNSDASDFVLPNTERQIECMQKALARARMSADQIDLVSMHATGTSAGDIQECQAVKAVFDNPVTLVNTTKGLIGHCMGAAGALELAGNLPSLTDGLVHPSFNTDELDPECAVPGLVIGAPKEKRVDAILNNSFGMLGINSALIITKFKE